MPKVGPNRITMDGYYSPGLFQFPDWEIKYLMKETLLLGYRFNEGIAEAIILYKLKRVGSHTNFWEAKSLCDEAQEYA